MLDNVKQTVQDAADTLADRAQERKADMKFDARLKAIERNISQVDNRIEALGKRFPRTQGPRFPFGLVLLAGLGYALYNPSTRRRLLDLIGNVSPTARDTLESVVGRASDAVDDVKSGRDPKEAVKDAAQDIGDKVGDKAGDIKHDVQKTGDRLADKATNTADQASAKASDLADDAKRGVDRLNDKAQNKLNDIKH
ncbi:hypothetical protein [Deinococcus altitudinis]|uniref:hypothetical protein n=1 Tax=Deinococcus altitudinis TaxID=468914 RepID=UPI0038911BC8